MMKQKIRVTFSNQRKTGEGGKSAPKKVSYKQKDQTKTQVDTNKVTTVDNKQKDVKVANNKKVNRRGTRKA